MLFLKRTEGLGGVGGVCKMKGEARIRHVLGETFQDERNGSPEIFVGGREICGPVLWRCVC